jgi:hypothetical protein
LPLWIEAWYSGKKNNKKKTKPEKKNEIGEGVNYVSSMIIGKEKIQNLL